jgi:hypothetical protein
MRRRKKGGVSGIVKTIPLSVALAALSTGVAFADAPNELVHVDMGNNSIYQLDLSLLNTDATYAANVRRALGDAFIDGRSIRVQVDGSRWLEFSENATAELTLDGIMNAGNQFEVGSDSSAILITPDMYSAF